MRGSRSSGIALGVPDFMVDFLSLFLCNASGPCHRRSMTVADDFQRFRANYLIPSATVSLISSRYKAITRRLNTDFWNTLSDTAHSLYVGSYGRDTAANGVSDLDVAFTLPNAVYHQYNGYSGNGQSALLQAVRASIAKTYPTTAVGGDGQVVAVQFTDGQRYEVLPVFLDSANKFTFADSNGGGSWRSYDPRAEMSAFSARDSATANGNLKAICRMARIWKSYCGVPISGMLIDTFAYNFIASWPHRDKSFMYHDYLVRDFMEYLSKIDRTQTYWLAPGSNSYVYKKGDFQTPAANAHRNAVEGVRCDVAKLDWAYTQAWRKIFGTTFPIR